MDNLKSAESNLAVMIIMYNVNAQGFNLDRCCNNVLILIPARNLAVERQAWGIILRVSYPYSDIEMWRLIFVGFASSGSRKHPNTM